MAIIDGMEMDSHIDIRARSPICIANIWPRLSGGYRCGFSATRTPAGERVAAEVGRALQLANIHRDLAEDARRHRLYLPREVLRAHGIYATTPSWVLAQPALSAVKWPCSPKKHYAAAAETIAAPRRTMRPAAVMLHIYHVLLYVLLTGGWRHFKEASPDLCLAQTGAGAPPRVGGARPWSQLGFI